MPQAEAKVLTEKSSYIAKLIHESKTSLQPGKRIVSSVHAIHNSVFIPVCLPNT